MQSVERGMNTPPLAVSAAVCLYVCLCLGTFRRGAAAASAPPTTRPNFLILFVDDLGKLDVASVPKGEASTVAAVSLPQRVASGPAVVLATVALRAD